MYPFVVIAIIIITYIYLAFCIGNLTFVALLSHKKLDVLDFGLRFLRTFFCAVNVHLGSFILTKSCQPSQNLQIGGQSKLRTFLNIVVALFGIVQLINLFQVISDDLAIVRYGETFLFGSNEMNGNTLRFGIVLHWIPFISISIVPGYLISGYVELCKHLCHRINSVASEVRHVVASKQVEKAQLIHLQSQIFTCWEHLKYIDKQYSTLAFAWFMDMIVTVVLSVRSVMRGFHSIYSAFDAIYYLLMFFVLTLNASNIDCANKALQLEVLNLRQIFNNATELPLGRLMLMENGLRYSRMVLTSAHFCSIDRPFIVAVLGAMATYTILLVQLAPSEDGHSSVEAGKHQ